MPLEALGIADLLKSTLRDLGRMKFQQVIQVYQDYEVFSHWFRKDKVFFEDGIGIQRNMMLTGANVAKHVGLYATDDVDVFDHLQQLQIPWRHATTNWGFERRELLMNRGKSVITKIIKPRRANAVIKLAEILEDAAWTAPASTDTIEPYGIPYYLVKNATTGFNGGVPSGHTTVANISPTTYDKWKNYTIRYTNVTKDDLISEMRTAQRKINWKSPVDIEDFRKGMGQRLRLYTNDATIKLLETVGEQQNENIGRDIAAFGASRDVKFVDDVITFRRFPFVYVPKLDNDSTKPIYGVDHSTWTPVVLRGDFMKEEVGKAPNQHNITTVFMDLTYNYLCIDRRRNFVANTA